MATETDIYDEDHQTVEFYKIKLMEKERVISDFQAKMKKRQFKVNLEIKQLKMSGEKAKNQLKQQKLKVQKLTKTSLQATQQNKILQHRMNEIKEEKDKQIQGVRNQYNHLKVEVRSYQRILPTLTFLNELGAKIDQLPTYEEIFSNLKQRAERCESLQSKLKITKEEMLEKIQTYQKIQQNLKKNKLELEKSQRDQLAKMFELQSQVSALQVDLQQTRNYCQKIEQLSEDAMEKIESLTEEKNMYEEELQQFRINYQADIMAKEEEIRNLAEQYFQKHEKQTLQVRMQYEQREQSRLRQLIDLQQSERNLLQKIEKDKQRYDENMHEYQIYNQKIKLQLEQKQHQIQNLFNNLDKLRNEVSQLSGQRIELLRKIAEKQMLIEKLSKSQVQLRQKQKQIQSKYDAYCQQANQTIKNQQETILDLEQMVGTLRTEIFEKEKQVMILNNQLEDYKNKGILQNRSSFPVTALDLTGLAFMNGSLDSSFKDQKEQKDDKTDLKISDIVNDRINLNTDRSKSRRNSAYMNPNSRKSISSQQPPFINPQNAQEQLKAKIKKTEEQYELKLEQSRTEIKQLKQKQQQMLVNLKTLQKQKQQLQQQLIKSKQVKSDLQMQVTQQRLKIKSSNDQISILKQKLESQHQIMTKKHTNLNSEIELLRKDKEGLQKQWKKEQEVNNSMKTNIKQLEKQIKQLKKQNDHLQSSIKKYKEKLQQGKQLKEQMKQKQASISKNLENKYKDIIEKYKEQINKLVIDNEESINQITAKDDEIIKYRREIQQHLETIAERERKLQLNQKEIQILGGQLDHERKDRTLRTVPSLASLDENEELQQQQNYKQFYNQAPQKQIQIAMLEREVEGLKQQVQDLKQVYEHKLQNLQQQSAQYIQQIIRMKVVAAEYEMKASQKMHLYNQMKKKMMTMMSSEKSSQN